MAEERETLGMVLFPGYTALDLVGPLEVLGRSRLRCLLVAKTPEPVTSDRGLRIIPDTTLDACPRLDALFVPGGPGQTPAMEDQPLISFIARRHAEARWTASVCTGALLLARAGVLAGRRATTHWLAMEELGRLGAIPTRGRIIEDGNVITGAGVSAGIDLALALVARWQGEAAARKIQLAIEYDPQPPFDSGTPEHTPDEIVQELKANSRFHGKRPKS